LSDPIPSAASLAGLLADDDRRAVFAALVLGSTTLGAVCATTGLDEAAAGKALARLVNGGLVERSPDVGLRLVGSRFGEAARAAAVPRTDAVPPGTPAAEARVRRAFFSEGRLVSIPARQAKRRVVLDVLVQEFEPGRRYSEATVDAALGRWYEDSTTLRRLLVDEGFLSREGGVYWRTGGSVADPRS
jgi:hypothetical protein